VFPMIAAGGLILLLDQWTKTLVLARVGGRCICWGPVLRIRRVAHRRNLYVRDTARAGLVLVWLTALISAVVLHASGAWFQGPIATLGLSLAFGGAAGNLLDILRRQCVIDFIDLRWWPVFNVADVAIVAGLLAAFRPHW
jgi:signal peptidase II